MSLFVMAPLLFVFGFVCVFFLSNILDPLVLWSKLKFVTSRANPYIPDVTSESIGAFKLTRISWGMGRWGKLNFLDEATWSILYRKYDFGPLDYVFSVPGGNLVDFLVAFRT